MHDAALRAGHFWSTFGVLSCECSLEEKIRGDGGDWTAGMAVRIVDIDVTGVNRSVDRDTLAAIDGINRNYGHAGPAFVQQLVHHGVHRQGEALRERVSKAAALIADTSDGATVRAAIPFALMLIAGEMAVQFGLLPSNTRVREAVQWAWNRFRKSSDAAALDAKTQAVENIRQWVAGRWDVTIKSVTYPGMNNREAVAWYDDLAIYIPADRIREAAGKTLKETQIGEVLDKAGLLAAKPEPDRYTVRWVPHVGRVAAYALSRREFGRSEHAADPDGFMTHQGRQHG